MKNLIIYIYIYIYIILVFFTYRVSEYILLFIFMSLYTICNSTYFFLIKCKVIKSWILSHYQKKIVILIRIYIFFNLLVLNYEIVCFCVLNYYCILVVCVNGCFALCLFTFFLIIYLFYFNYFILL